MVKERNYISDCAFVTICMESMYICTEAWNNIGITKLDTTQIQRVLRIEILQASIRPRGYKTFFMLNSAEHEILNAHKYENLKKNQHFSGSDKPRMLFFLLIYVKMPTIVGMLTFVSRKNFMLS